ncbi:MAG: hypothetical protein SGPRY_010957 [Prymnesium sp.]
MHVCLLLPARKCGSSQNKKPPSPSDGCRQALFGEFAHCVQYTTEKKQDSKWTTMHCEAVLECHFHGAYGLLAERKDAKVANEDGNISDQRRIIQLDELPQFVDY